jgi:hypothetical protein
MTVYNWPVFRPLAVADLAFADVIATFPAKPGRERRRRRVRRLR